MNIGSLGKNIRKYRLQNNISQEKLAELVDVSPNYIGMLERSDKIPALKTFIKLSEALGVTPDMLLLDVIKEKIEIRNTSILNRMDELPEREQERIYAVIDTLLEHAEKD
ncbi:MAG: helix-turn-helix transcriptional regulator [Eubacterium sp.]|nr:helix-turn-helix transcriptional regulator [Eubacterium sp.]